MTRLKPGDRVNCRLKGGEIIIAYKEGDETKTFEIVALGDYGYYLFVPQYYSVKDTIPINAYRLKKMNIDPRFLNEEMIHINENMVCQIVQRLTGCPAPYARSSSPWLRLIKKMVPSSAGPAARTPTIEFYILSGRLLGTSPCLPAYQNALRLRYLFQTFSNSTKVSGTFSPFHSTVN